MSEEGSERISARSQKGASDGRRRGQGAEKPEGTVVRGLRAAWRFGWNRKYTLTFLLLMVLLAFAVRTVWYYDAAYTGGLTPLLSGNDPDYHKRTVDYFVDNHHFLTRDPLIDYSRGGPNPNPPAYSTSIALIGYLLTPFFGFDLKDAVWFSMEIAAALWAALTVIPVYLFTKEMFGRKAGYAAAFIIAMMAGNIERTPLGFSDHDAFFMFFTVTGFFFLLKALRLVKTRNYVRSWRVPYDITAGLQTFARANIVPILYSAMAGLSLATVALAWKGFTYTSAIIFVYLLFHLMLNKFRRLDNTAVGIIVLVAVSVQMLLPLPYYMSMHFMHWYMAPAIVYAAICVTIAVFIITRDLPWLLIIPVLLGLIAVVLTAVYFMLPDVWVNIFSGAGYFIRTKLYGTIAEAQPPDVNRLVFSYGLATFFLALAGVFIMLKDMPKGWKNDHVFTTIWSLTAIYMAVAAIRFMYNATPIFAILSGWMTYEILRRMDYRKMVRVFRSMRGDLRKAFKYSVKVRHVAGVVFLVCLIVLPNTWNAVDAGIPYETKKKADLKVYNALPDFMHPSKDLYDPDSNSLWYFGSFGTSFMNDYWAQGMWWLRSQDDWQDEADRPAFISWWDYGHWCVQVGQHPTAADNFQNGVEFAGNFIAATSQEQAEALMLLRLMQIEHYRPEVKQYMYETFGEANATFLIDLFVNPSDYTGWIAKYPERYGLKDKEVSSVNTVFIVGTYAVERALTEEQIVQGLLWFRTTLGKEFRYFAVDSRLMPLSYQNTGIFYAPITLSDNRVDEYIEVVAVYNGNEITLEQASQLPTSERENLEYKLVWKRPFYDSMFYRAFMGYSGYDRGPAFKDAGIPLVTGDLQSSIPLYGWNMTHWRVVHRTVHWNPWNETSVSEHSLDWESISEEDAARLYAAKEGTVDELLRTIGDGVIYLKYYAGAWVNGTVTTETGEPVSGALVTVFDDFRFYHQYYGGSGFFGIPHGTTTTDDQGRYSILAPFGNVTVVASNGGGLDYTYLLEQNILNSTNVLITDDQSMRVGDYNLTADLLVPSARLNGTLYIDTNGDSKHTDADDEELWNATVTLSGTARLNRTYELGTFKDGFIELFDMLPGTYNVSATYNGHTVTNFTTITLASNASLVQDIAMPQSAIKGKLTRKDGTAVKGTELMARDLQNNITRTSTADAVGDYKFDKLLPGNYSIELYVPGTRPINESVELLKGKDATVNMTLLPTAFVEGTVWRDQDGDGQRDPSEGVANATISFTRVWGEPFYWTCVTNATGDYNTSLPVGAFTVYAHETQDDDHSALVRTLDVDPKDWAYSVDMELVEAFRLSGILKRRDTTNASKTVNATRAPVDIWTDDGRIRLTSNSTGAFAVWLPPGQYSMFASASASDRPLVDLRRVNVTDSPVDLAEVRLGNGTRIQGTVFFDRNNDLGSSSGEGRGGLDVVLEAEGYRFNTTTLSNGSYSLSAAPLNYTITIAAEGFETYTGHINATRNLATTGQNVPLKGINVSYDGMVGYDWNDDGKLAGEGFGGITVEFSVDSYPGSSGKATSITSGPDGGYSVALYPGSYRIKVTYDRVEPEGEYRYSYNAILEVLPGTAAKAYNISLDRLVRVTGNVTVVDGTPDTSEFIRVDEGASTEYVLVTNGKYDDHISVGNHTFVYELDKWNGSKQTITHMCVLKVELLRPTSIDLVALPVARFNGTVYYDKNQDGNFDAGEGVQVISFALMGQREEAVHVEANGAFDELFYPYANYTLLIKRTVPDPMGGGESELYHNSTLDLTGDRTMFIPVERRVPITGQVFWDRNGDNKSSSGEGVYNATVTFTSRKDGRTFTATTDTDGDYRVFLPVDNKTEASYGIVASLSGYSPKNTTAVLNVTSTRKAYNPQLVADNVTVSGLAFMDDNLNGALNRYEHGTPVHNITLWDASNASRRFTAEADGNGSFSVVLPPGTYQVHAWTYRGLGEIVHLGKVVVKPSAEAFEMELPMAKGLSASGAMYYHNHTGVNMTAPALNLTFTELDGDGVVPVVRFETGSFAIALPEGSYRVNGTFNTTQFGVEMKYKVDDSFRIVLEDDDEADLNFTKVPERKLKLTWSNIPAHIDQNKSVNYTVYCENTGSENATFDLSMGNPTGWTYKLERNNISLNMSQKGAFWVLINSSVKAAAGSNNCTLQATPRNATDAASKVVLEVMVNQVFGFEVKEPTQERAVYLYDTTRHVRHLSYSFLLENKGNGKDIINITASGVLNWTVVLPLGNVSLGAYMVEQFVPVEIDAAVASTASKQDLTITARSLTNPAGETHTLKLVLTFPDLTGKSSDVRLLENSKVLEQPKEAPGYGALLLLSALGASAVVARQRRSRGGCA